MPIKPVAAHEFCHAIVHKPTEAIVDQEIDPSRPSETAASGIEKVTDYSRHERREIQADLFARDLVLPRQWARQLFLQDRLSASAITERIGLPYPLVAQQLLDALLLPPYAAPSAKGGPPPELDASQKAAATHRGSALLLQAGPGTGKTRTLVARIGHLVENGVDPADILVLTFSNKAAGELSERLSISYPEAAAKAWVGTFHGFGLDVLRRFHDHDGLPGNPRLVDRADAIEFLEDLVPGLPLKHYRNLYDPTLDLGDILSAVSRAKDELVGSARYLELAQAMAAKATATNDEALEERAAKAIEVAAVYRVYDEALREAGRLDFGDLIMRTTLLIERNEVVRQSLHDRHREVLVDEFQDVSLIKALAGSGERLWVVGDSRQSIYRFRGASSANMVRFATDFPGAAVKRLKVNYCSSDEVVGTYVHFAKTMEASKGVLPLEIKANAGAGGERPELRHVDHPDDEAAAIAARVIALKAAGITFAQQAVLCRGNKRLGEIAGQLEEREIPVLFLGNLFERDEVQNLLALLSLVVDPRASGLPRVATMPRYALSLDDIGRIQAHAARCTAPLEWLREAPTLVSTESIRPLAQIVSDLAQAPDTSRPWDVLAALLLDQTDIVRDLVQAPRSSDRLKAIALWQFMLFCRTHPEPSGGLIERLLERIRRLVLLAEERDLRQMPSAVIGTDAVQLMTVHASKGLEFDAVHVPGMTVVSFPGKSQPQRCPPPDGMIADATGMSGVEAVQAHHQAEEQCLFFVAMSRARKHLTLYASSKQHNGNKREPSPYLAEIASKVTRHAVAELLRPSRSDASLDRVRIVWPVPPRFSAEQIALYVDCPRRFFYSYVLRVSSGRRVTPFQRMHDVVYEMIRWLRDDLERWHITARELEPKFQDVWAAKGPTSNGYAADYQRAALELLNALRG